MYIKKYNKDEILTNNNLIFDLKNDIVFKNIFLNTKCKPYLMLIISKLFKIDGGYLKNNFFIKNSELPSRKYNEKSRYTDLVCNYFNYDFIIEMNKNNSNDISNKNMDYLFRQHIGRISKKNRYGKNIFTYLINIDNYDYFKKKDFIYESNIDCSKYKIRAYKNIKVININLAILKYKYYNNIRLETIEKVFLIFVEQRVDKLRSILNYEEIEGVIKVMNELKYSDDFIATYDREEWENYLKEQDDKKRKEDEKKRREDEKKRNIDRKNREKLNKEVENFEKQKLEFNITKNNLIKSLINEGFTLEKISKMTKIPLEKIKTMLF